MVGDLLTYKKIDSTNYESMTHNARRFISSEWAWSVDEFQVS